MSEVTGLSCSFSPSPSDYETVSLPPSCSSTPDIHENLFISAATMSVSKDADPFCFQYELPARSTEFWFEDGSAVIEVENTWYNVHGSIMRRQSNFFREALPLSAYIYKGLRPPAFLDLPVGLLVPDHRRRVSGIANVATFLGFTFTRKAALESIIEKCDALELIDLSRKHDLTECVSSGVRELCFADKPLSLKDGKTIGYPNCSCEGPAREMQEMVRTGV